MYTLMYEETTTIEAEFPRRVFGQELYAFTLPAVGSRIIQRIPFHN